jgi:hypothetical protein
VVGGVATEEKEEQMRAYMLDRLPWLPTDVVDDAQLSLDKRLFPGDDDNDDDSEDEGD